MQYRILKKAALVSLLIAGVAALSPMTSIAGTPTLNCGNGYTIAGSDASGKVTVGTDSGTCTLTFSTPYANPPACMAMNETNGGGFATPIGAKSTTTTLILGGMSPWNPGDVISYLCQSY